MRLFAYGSLSVVLALYLAEVGLNEARIGLLLSLTLIGDMVVSLWLTAHADRLGRRRTLIVGAVLMVAAGAVFATAKDFWVLMIAATLGVISPSGNEVGPFLPIEQASLSQIISERTRTKVFARYTLVGSLATAFGSLAGGLLIDALKPSLGPLVSYRIEAGGYAFLGIGLLWLFTRLSPRIEVVFPSRNGTQTGSIHYWKPGKFRRIVLKLSAFFALDAFGGGFIVQSIAVLWFRRRFGVSEVVLGEIFFGANILAGFSALAAARLASRFGLINTMVFTHLPSNILLMLVPLMPNLPLAIAVLFLRFSISQMDVPARQSYVMAVVPPQERSLAAGVTGVARSIGAALAPFLAGLFMSRQGTLDLPFYCAGGLKIAYDFLLYHSFISVRPPEEMVSLGKRD